MAKLVAPLLVLAAALFITGCDAHSNYNWGTDHDAEPAGSYSGSTLNSPVTDQNSHVGGDRSYPASVSDQGPPPTPPEKTPPQ